MVRIAVVFLSIIFLIFGFVIASVLTSDEEVSEPVATQEAVEFDREQYDDLVNEYLVEKKDAVLDVKNDGKLFDVVINDDWHNLEDFEKERVADAIYEDMQSISQASNITEPGGAIDVVLLDEANKKVASKGLFGGWKLE